MCPDILGRSGTRRRKRSLQNQKQILSVISALFLPTRSLQLYPVCQDHGASDTHDITPTALQINLKANEYDVYEFFSRAGKVCLLPCYRLFTLALSPHVFITVLCLRYGTCDLLWTATRGDPRVSGM